MKIRLLGTGTSTGVPRIGNDWGACDPAEPRNRRTRVSALVETPGVRVLIDTGPDMREQLLAAEVGRVDAILWTHDHADHIHGIDDVRQLAQNAGQPIEGYARGETAAAIEQRFSYILHGAGGYRPVVRLSQLPDQLMLGDLAVTVVDQPHGRIASAGLRFDHAGSSIVYSTDFSMLTADMRKTFEHCDLWVLDTLRREPHPSHPHLAAALDYIAAVAPKRAVLIHMDNSMDYATLGRELPAGIEPGYDGMEFVL